MSRAEAAALLGIDPVARPAEVQRAFLRAARHVHPDALPDAPPSAREEAAARFDLLNRARETLLRPAAGSLEGARTAPTSAVPAMPLRSEREARDLAGSFVVLALLAFLMVAIVSFDDAIRSGRMGPAPVGTPAVSQVP